MRNQVKTGKPGCCLLWPVYCSSDPCSAGKVFRHNWRKCENPYSQHLGHKKPLFRQTAPGFGQNWQCESAFISLPWLRNQDSWLLEVSEIRLLHKIDNRWVSACKHNQCVFNFLRNCSCFGHPIHVSQGWQLQLHLGIKAKKIMQLLDHASEFPQRMF